VQLFSSYKPHGTDRQTDGVQCVMRPSTGRVAVAKTLPLVSLLWSQEWGALDQRQATKICAIGHNSPQKWSVYLVYRIG